MSVYSLILIMLLSPIPRLAEPAQAEELRSGQSLEFKLGEEDPVLDGFGPSRSFSYTVHGGNTVLAYAESDSIDLFLRVRDASGKVLSEDDSSGGGTTPFIMQEVMKDQKIGLTVAGRNAGASGKVRLHLFEVIETEETREAVKGADRKIRGLEPVIRAGNLDQAREVLSQVTHDLLRVQNLKSSRLISEQLWSTGVLSLKLNDPATALKAFEAALDFRNRTLPDDHPDLQGVRMNYAVTLRHFGDLASARRLEEKVLEVRSRLLPSDHHDLQEARLNLAVTLKVLGDLKTAKKLMVLVLEVWEKTLDENHPDLQKARVNLAGILDELGDLDGARRLNERALEAYERTLPESHPKLQGARLNLAVVLRKLGQLKTAKELFEQAVYWYERTLPKDHPDLLTARMNLAVTIGDLGDLETARRLQEEVLAVRERTLPDDHLDLQQARVSLATTLEELGESKSARALLEKAVKIYESTLPDDHPDLHRARFNLAVTLKTLGELHAGKDLDLKIVEIQKRTLPGDHPDLLETRLNLASTDMQLGNLMAAKQALEEILVILERTLPDDHDTLLAARSNLAETLAQLGDLQTARGLEEKVLEVYERKLPPDHLNLQAVRLNLGATIKELGDLVTAKKLFEQVLEVLERLLPSDHPYLQIARMNLAVTTRQLGDFKTAREQFEKILAVYEDTLPGDHPLLQQARYNLAITLSDSGDPQTARDLLEKALEVYERTLFEDHPDLQATRQILAGMFIQMGDPDAGRELYEGVLEARERTLPDSHPDLQLVRSALLWERAKMGEVESSADLLIALCLGLKASILSFGETLSPRELEALTVNTEPYVSGVLSILAGVNSLPPLDYLEPEGFSLTETARSVAATRIRLARVVGSLEQDKGVAELRREIREAASEVSRTALSAEGRELFFQAVRRKEKAQRALQEHLSHHPALRDLIPRPDVNSIADSLQEKEAAVGYWRYHRWRIDRENKTKSGPVPSYLAYIIRSGNRLERVELGSAAVIDGAVEEWRKALLEREGDGGSRGLTPRGRRKPGNVSSLKRGEMLRSLIFDPLRPHLEGAKKLTVVLDDSLFSIPLDALPDDDGVLGDSYQITFRNTLKGLTVRDPRPLSPPSLLAMGGIDYDLETRSPPGSGLKGPAPDQSDRSTISSLDRGTPVNVLRTPERGKGFSYLSGTAAEVEMLEEYFGSAFPEGRSMVVQEQFASRGLFEDQAPGVRYLHLATHAYFAPESVPSTRDDRQETGNRDSASFSSHHDQVAGYAPMVLCGIAFAGANMEPTKYGRVPGVMTAEELAAMDLGGCELAVLSACETNVGIRRTGQGIASLQQALEAAGVRSAITSLWRVSDEATRSLMSEFYRQLWIEEASKAQALWRSKQRLRSQKDPDGSPNYTTRDWAGWMLTGDPE